MSDLIKALTLAAEAYREQAMDATADLILEAIAEITRFHKALSICGAPWDSGPTTVSQGYALLGKEFERRMQIANHAIRYDAI